MKRFSLVIVIVLSSLLSVAQADRKPKKEPKPPELEVVSLKAVRKERTVEIDCAVRNSGLKPLQRIKLTFELRASEGGVVTARSLDVEEESLAPGEEAEVSVETPDEARAVRITVSALDKEGRLLIVSNAGPVPIE